MGNARQAVILVVEDNRADAQLTLTALRDAHMSPTIFVVTDGEQALAFLNRVGDTNGWVYGELNFYPDKKKWPWLRLMPSVVSRRSIIHVTPQVRNQVELLERPGGRIGPARNS